MRLTHIYATIVAMSAYIGWHAQAAATPVTVMLDLNLATVQYRTITVAGEHYYVHQGTNIGGVYIQTDDGTSTGAYTGGLVSTHTYLGLYPLNTRFGPSDNLAYTQKNSSDTLVSPSVAVAGLKTLNGTYGFLIFRTQSDGVHLLEYGYETVAGTAITAALPEPASAVLLLAGAVGMVAIGRRRFSLH